MLIVQAKRTTVTVTTVTDETAGAVKGGERTTERDRAAEAGTATEAAVSVEAVTIAGVITAKTGGMSMLEGTGKVPHG